MTPEYNTSPARIAHRTRWSASRTDQLVPPIAASIVRGGEVLGEELGDHREQVHPRGAAVDAVVAGHKLAWPNNTAPSDCEFEHLYLTKKRAHYASHSLYL